jgi:putative chitinase
MGNRDEASDDGWRFRGSGWVQLTGHDNFYHFGKAVGVDVVMKPDLVRTPQYAALSAGWFWSTHDCNRLAEASDWNRLTRKINGGIIGLADRIKHTEQALAVLIG